MAAAVSKLQAAIEKALPEQLEVKEGEKRSAFLSRLAKATKAIPDEDFDNKLNEQAQEWVNKAGKAIKAGKAVPEFPDYEGAEDDEPAAKKGKGAGKKEKAPKEKKERETGPSAKSLLVELRLKSPKASIDDLVKKLESKGHKLTEASIKTIDGHCRGVIRVATAIGWVAPAKAEAKADDKDE